MCDDVADFSKLSVEERCVHRAWQARQSGYESATKLFTRLSDDKVSEWTKYGNLLKAFVTDKNAAAQEKGVEAATVFLDNCPKPVRYATELLPLAIQGLAVQRTRAQRLTMDLVLECFEVKPDAAVDELLVGCRSKNPKAAQASLIVLREAVSQFGSKVVNVNKIVKALPGALSDREKGTRDEAVKLAIELHRWGVPLKQVLKSLREILRNQLEASFAKIPSETLVPTRMPRAQRLKKNDGSGEPIERVVQVVKEKEEIVESDVIVAVDVLSKLTDDFFSQLSSKKWIDRRAGIEYLADILESVQKLAPGEYGDIIICLTNIVVNDANVVVIGGALQCLSYIVRGLGKRFLPYLSKVLPPVILAFKEKKPIVVKSCRNAIDSLLFVANIEDIWADFKIGFDNKNPNVRTETVMAVARWAGSQTTMTRKVLKLLMTPLTTALGDPEPSVRDAAAIAIASAAFVCGEPMINPFIAGLGEVKINKIKAQYGKTDLWAVSQEDSSNPLKKQPFVGAKLLQSKEPVKTNIEVSSRTDIHHENDNLETEIKKLDNTSLNIIQKSPRTEIKIPLERSSTKLTDVKNEKIKSTVVQKPRKDQLLLQKSDAPKTYTLIEKSPRTELQKTKQHEGKSSSTKSPRDIKKLSKDSIQKSPRTNKKSVKSDSKSTKVNEKSSVTSSKNDSEANKAEEILRTVRALLTKGSEASCKLEDVVGSLSTDQLRHVFLTEDIKKEPRLWAEGLSALRRLLCIRGHHDSKIEDEANLAASTSNLSVRESALALMNTLQSIARRKEIRRLSV